MELKHLQYNKQGNIDPEATYMAWEDYIIKSELNIPTGKERESVLELIHEHFNYTPEVITRFVDNFIWHRINNCPPEVDKYIRKNERDRQSVKDVLKSITGGGVTEIKIKIMPNSGNPVTISNPEFIAGILNYLDSLPEGKTSKPQRGQPEKQKEKHFKKYIITSCTYFIKGTVPPVNYEYETEILFFAGLVMSLVGVTLTPEQYCQQEKIDLETGFSDYKKDIADKLKYYR